MYRALYNYLFDIAKPDTANKMSTIKSEINQLKNAMTRYKSFIGTSKDFTSGNLKQIIDGLQKEEETLQLQLNDIASSKYFMENRDTIVNSRNKYLKVIDNINTLDFKLRRTQESIATAVDEKKQNSMHALAKQFFNEIKTILPDINKSFEQLVAFNNRLYDNKIDYFSDIASKLSKRKEELENEKKELLETNKRYLGLIQDNDIEKFDSLSKKILANKKSLSAKEEQLDTLVRFENELLRLSSRFEELQKVLETENSNFKHNIDKFNFYFTNIVENVTGEKPMLLYNEDDSLFPLSIINLEEGTGTGSLKSLVFCYDIAYQIFAKDAGLNVPEFVVHDVLENIEGDKLKKIVEKANTLDSQFIVAILKEKLDSSKISKEVQQKGKLISLSNNHRIFE
jgi:hypothetical protein